MMCSGPEIQQLNRHPASDNIAKSPRLHSGSTLCGGEHETPLGDEVLLLTPIE